MDMLILFMLFCSITPFLLWSRRRNLALIQFPLVIGMWAYFLLPFFHLAMPSTLHALLTVLFLGNLLYTEFALIRFCIDFGNDLKKNKKERSLFAELPSK